MKKLYQRFLDDLADAIAIRLLDATQSEVQESNSRVDDDRYTDFERSLLAQRGQLG